MPIRFVTSACAAVLLAPLALAGGIEPLTREQVVAGGVLARPVFVTHAPGDHGRIFIVEQRSGNIGRVRVFDLTTNQFLDTAANPFLAVSPVTTNSEQGLLGLAFHPDYANNGYFFVNFTNTSGTVVRRYSVSENNPNLADPNSAKTIMTFTQPATNHNGGWIGFGPEGYLYIATGDGGGSGDPSNNSQNLTNLLGKMLRVNVDVTNDAVPYSIPPDNPLVGQIGIRREIWAWGLRNPWRASFDREFGDLYIADVGQFSWEEVNFQHADSAGGENYGWKCYEGVNNFAPANCPGSPALNWPFHTYGISGSTRCAVIGGYVYRGCEIPSLRGTYFFADYCPGHVFGIKYDRDGNVPPPSSSPPASHPVSDFADLTSVLGTGVANITSFGQDAAGEIYFTSLFAGIYRIIPVTPTIAPADLDCNGVVDVFDLLALLAAWGPCPGCKADLTGSGAVDVFDLLELLSQWG